MPLSRYPGLRTPDPDEAAEKTRDLLRRFRFRSFDRGGLFVAHTAKLELSAVSWVSLSGNVAVSEADDRSYLFCQLKAGKLERVENGRRDWVSAGEGYVSHPNAEATGTQPGDVEVFSVRVPAQLVQAEATALAGRPAGPLEILSPIPRNAPACDLADFILRQLDRPDGLFAQAPAASRALERAFIACLVESTNNNYRRLIEQGSRRGLAGAYWHVRIVRRAEDYMQENLEAPVALGDLARAAGVSKRALQEAFAYVDKAPPMRVFRNMQLDRARYLLEHPTPHTTVQSIAFLFGYIDPGSFTKAYHAYHGKPPSQSLPKGFNSDIE